MVFLDGVPISTDDETGPVVHWRDPKVLQPRKTSPSFRLDLYHVNCGVLEKYDPVVGEAPCEYMASRHENTLLVPDGRSGYYWFDLVAMEQHFVSHVIDGRPILSDKAPVKVIAVVPRDAAVMASVAVKANKSLRRKVSPAPDV